MMRGYLGGLACRFPESRNVQEFWENLIGGVEMIGPTRWPQGLYNTPPNIGAMKDVDKFDASFFEVPDLEANNMNPMLRHLLEVTYECIVDSGLPLKDLQDTKTGFYLGCFGSDNDALETFYRGSNLKADHVSTSPYLTGEIMRVFGLTGPVITVDTAGSSSVSALNMAITDLETDRCQYAIVAASNLVLFPQLSQQMTISGMLSPDGQSRVFDQGAKGYVRAEGTSAILLARSADDLRRVYVAVKDVAISCDGFKSAGIDSPSSESQAALSSMLYDVHGIDVNNVKYVEAHGTGTQADDVAETKGIAEVFCSNRKEPLLIGSVKSNIGHTEAAAGLAAIVKVVLAMQHKELPANRHFDVPNPRIPGLSDGKLQVVNKNMPLPSNIVGINSFGLGGVNGHVILERYTDDFKEDFFQVPGQVLVPITVRTPESVEVIREFVINNRYNTSLMELLSGSLLSCDYRQPIRAYIHLGPNVEDVTLRVGDKMADVPPVYLGLKDFVWDKILIAKDLLEIEEFRISITTSQEILKQMDRSIDLMELIDSGQPLEACTLRGLLTATAAVVALFDCLEIMSIPLAGVVGCGVTEVVASFLDGCITLHQCLSIMVHVGEALETFHRENSERWNVYEVRLPIDKVYQLGHGIQVLTVQDQDLVIVAMELKYRDSILDRIHKQGGIYRQLPVQMPLYTGFMTDIANKLRRELKDILPAPKYRSCHMFSARNNWLPMCTVSQPLCDAEYFSSVICQPCNLPQALAHLPSDSLLIDLKATSRPPSKKCMESMDRPDSVPGAVRTPILSARPEGLFPWDKLDPCQKPLPSSLLHCEATATSLLKCLGELHLHGYQLDVSPLYQTLSEGPLGCEVPCLSPLVRWDHSVSWNIPEWQDFSVREKDVQTMPYTLFEEDIEGIHSPQAMLLYHAWSAIIQRTCQPDQGSGSVGQGSSILLYDLVLASDIELDNKMLPGTIIQVLPGRKHFAAVQKDMVLLQGNYERSDSFDLPKIPGYDLDINENVDQSLEDSESLFWKTEVRWEDNWLDFINDVLEFANQNTEAPLYQVTIDTRRHQHEAKDCDKFLVVYEKYTGLCKSGGCVLQFDVVAQLPPQDDGLWQSQVRLDNPERSHISKVMLYNVHGYDRAGDRVMVYMADRDTEDGGTAPVLGLVNMAGEKGLREAPLPADWTEESLEVFVPYILAAHILYDVAKVKEGQTILVLPPIDTVGVYLLSLACQTGCSVFTSTWDRENQDILDSIFPLIRVLPGDELYQNIMVLTQGRGVDVCIRCSGGEVNTAMDLVAQNGHLVLCRPPPAGNLFDFQVFNKNFSLSTVPPRNAFIDFIGKSTCDIQALLYTMQEEEISKLSIQGFPEPTGLLYSLEDKSSFIQPVSLDNLMTLLTDPGLPQSSAGDLNEADTMAIERIQDIVAPRPKDCSMMETSRLQQTTGEELDIAMMMTPQAGSGRRRSESFTSPDVHIISMREPDNLGADGKTPQHEVPKGLRMRMPPTSTPMFGDLDVEGDSGCQGDGKLEESYLDQQTRELSSISRIQTDQTDPTLTLTQEKREGVKADVTISIYNAEEARSGAQTQSVKTDKATPQALGRPGRVPSIQVSDTVMTCARTGIPYPGTPMPSTVPTPTFQRLMNRKAKPVPAQLHLPKPRIDIVMMTPPMSPMTPALKDLLTPCKMVPTLVPLNLSSVSKERPLFIVHPITGVVNLLEKLGGGLAVPCYGIQKTCNTPTDSIESVASYYKNSIEMLQPRGPYRIAGYCLGSMIAMEIALQMQAQGQEVEHLILLDGSTGYFHAQIAAPMSWMPTHATHQEVQDGLEAGLLVNWMLQYGPVKDKRLTFNWLRKLPTEEKITTAVDLTEGSVIVSSSERKTKWLTAKEKVLKAITKKKTADSPFYSAAKELIRLKRKEKAEIFVGHVMMARHYRPHAVFEGDVHLLRVKVSPIFQGVAELDPAYGLQETCTGSVHVKYYRGNHETFLVKDDLESLTKDIHLILGIKV